MTLPDLMHALDTQGVRLSARLVVDAPAGAVTPELRDALAEHKPALLRRVVRAMAWDELAALRWGPAVGDPAPGIAIDRPDRGRMLAAALAADRDDAYAVAERRAIQGEASHCDVN